MYIYLFLVTKLNTNPGAVRNFARVINNPNQLTLRYRDYPPINLTQSGVDRMDRIFKGKM